MVLRKNLKGRRRTKITKYANAMPDDKKLMFSRVMNAIFYIYVHISNTRLMHASGEETRNKHILKLSF